MLNFTKAIDYHYDKFPPGKLDYSFFMDNLLKATEALARFDQMLKNMHNNEIFLAPLRNQEAVMSSRMEGTISTMDEVMEYQLEDEINLNVKNDIIETILYQRTMRSAQKSITDGYEITPGFIRSMHQQLLSLGRGAQKNPGQFKVQQNYLGDEFSKSVYFIPIIPEKLQEGLEKWSHFAEHSTFPHLIKTAILHLEFEALHPFEDGNGRIGRMLIPLLLWKYKLINEPHFYISGYFDEHKELYIKRLREVSRTNNWNQWIDFFLQAITEQANKNLEITQKIQNLYDQMKSEFLETLSSKWSVVTLDFIFSNPVFRTNNYYKLTGIPQPTGNNILRKLNNKGLLQLREEASGSKPALYSFELLMRLIRV